MERIKQFSRSLSCAFRGLVYTLKNEKNFQNELGIGLVVVFAMIYFGTTKTETVVLIIIIMAVLIMELLNTIMERVVDILEPRVHPYARLIKDLMAASVLLTSILAIIIGLIIFVPYILK
jgi:diacylglycerol kinase